MVNILTYLALVLGQNYEKYLPMVGFSGNISFIDTMILSKFQVDCITPTDFGNFLNYNQMDANIVGELNNGQDNFL